MTDQNVISVLRKWILYWLINCNSNVILPNYIFKTANKIFYTFIQFVNKIYIFENIYEFKIDFYKYIY